MATQPKPKRNRRQADKAVQRLFTALEKVIAATETAKQARDALVRLGNESQEARRA